MDNFIEALKFLCLTVEKNMLYPGVIENWNLIIDASDVDIFYFTTDVYTF